MGTFTDNLLKLTEFPFSYSFIGLLALTFGEGLNLDEPSFANLGPLLILMGFFATTLSITDPIGRLQKVPLKGGFRLRWAEFLAEFKNKEPSPDEFLSLTIFGIKLDSVFEPGSDVPEKLQPARGAPPELTSQPVLASLASASLSKRSGLTLTGGSIGEIMVRVISLSDQTLRTPWIEREIDKITSMIYFMIVIVAFMLFLYVSPDLEDKFVATFQGISQTGGGDDDTTTTGSGSNPNEQAQEEQQQLGQSVREETGTTGITGKDLMIQRLQEAIAAVEANDTQTAMLKVDAALEASRQLDENEVAYIIIVILLTFSAIALFGIFAILLLRRNELKKNTLMVFKYLAVREAHNIVRRKIKIESDTFEKSVQAVEQYLTNGNWTLARITVDEMISDYHELYFEKIQPKLAGPREE